MEQSTYRSRLEALQALQQKHGVACTALVPGANLRYFTGLAGHLSERPTVAFIPAAGPPALVIPVLEAPSALPFLPEDAMLYTYRDEDGHEQAFAQAAADLQLDGQAVAVEFLTMRLLESTRIQQSAPGARLLATEPWLPGLRMTKDAAEIAAMRRAVEIAEAALQRLLDEGAIRPGRTELEIAADLQVAMLRASGQGEAFPPLVVAGPNSASPHAGPSGRPLAEGDLVIVDWGTVYDGYRSDITRTFVLGTPTPEMVRIHDAVLAANQSGRLAARPGLPAQEVDRAARRAITLAGYGDYFIHRTGHGLGLETHEPPYLVEGNLDMLGVGMTFTVEPGIYLPGVGGVRIEDDVVVTGTGSETLTSLPRELVCL
ncbi:MAG: aminopeptidase P family protein [Anaerolineae bacterium]|nr:aminopeptidase P family protein [Anaerolineae bacterium]